VRARAAKVEHRQVHGCDRRSFGTEDERTGFGKVSRNAQASASVFLIDLLRQYYLRVFFRSFLTTCLCPLYSIKTKSSSFLYRLDEFKKLNPPVDLVQGAEIEMTIRGDTLLYKNAVGGVGTVRSAAFTKAMCDVYYGSDPVSPTHKQEVLEGIKKL